MNKTLNITNGDSTVNIMKEAKIQGDFLPWQDVLHVGPVPEGLSFEELSQVRADYIIEKGWGAPQNIQQSFDERLEVLANIEQYDKIILWFEHDLYDQLQILEILDWFTTKPLLLERLSIICTENYLGMLSVEELMAMPKYEEPVTKEHLTLATKAWTAFRSPTPERWQALLEDDTSVLPFLEGAVLRMLEEYPSQKNGLSRTAQKALDIIAKGEEKRPKKIFGLYTKTEERLFLGDTVFWDILSEMLVSNPPLLTLKDDKPLLPISPEQVMEITDVGQEVLSGEKSWLDVHVIDHWIGGVHMRVDNVWYWDGKIICK